MENPRLRIESDGKYTEVYIDGKQIRGGTMIDFHFLHDVYGEPAITCTLTQNVLDVNYHPIVENNEIKKQTVEIF